MPRIFDNINERLLSALQETLKTSERADFCVGYFNLRGWNPLAEYIDRFDGGNGKCCRLLVGMIVSPTDEMRRMVQEEKYLLDNQTAMKEKRRIAEEFKRQLLTGFQSNADEATLRKISAQIRSKKLFVRVYLQRSLHAKLYLLYRQDPNNPVTGFLGSSNLTFAGLSGNGELNVDVLEHDACGKLSKWFDERWLDRWCVDISSDLAEIINESWAGERLVKPYHVYLKMAYHLAQEARAGLSEFRIPAIFGNTLFDFQVAAVKIAAHHLNKRRGVMIGDVVGLGKTMMATALAKVCEEDYHTETLIICPKNVESMWQDYKHRYQIIGDVLPLSRVISVLPKARRYRLVLIDESHNLRNKEGKHWRVIRDYIERNDCLTVLLSATPYNKSYMDLSAQLALFLNGDADIGIRPETLLSELGGEHEFIKRFQCGVRSLAAFEKSDKPDDWRELMRLYMVRRTRGFIMQNYAREDERGKYLLFTDGNKSYFPKRIPKTLKFGIDENNPGDPYARFYSDAVVSTIGDLNLPRYGLANYAAPKPKVPPTSEQSAIMDGLSRAGNRLKGFCRTNLFKRLESSGHSFVLSLERHILRNFVVLHAIENGLDIPIGAQDSSLLDERFEDEDSNILWGDDEYEEERGFDETEVSGAASEKAYRVRAGEIYEAYSAMGKRFKWLPPHLFKASLGKDLYSDAHSLLRLLNKCGEWRADIDTKLSELSKLINAGHRNDKVLVFTQFADTARYLAEQLKITGVKRIEAVTGQSDDPAELARRFSPQSNENANRTDELNVLIATDVLSEGQNLQDAHIIVNYDIPWAIIRLIQRAGRVDRIGQKSGEILCYSFMPADGVERIIRLRARIKQRMAENAEVVGSDENFFDDDTNEKMIRDLYTEKDGSLDDDGDNEVDLASYAYQIWKNATDADPSLAASVEKLNDVVYSTKNHTGNPASPNGVLVYMRTSQGNDALSWIDEHGNAATQSQLAILRAASCSVNTEALQRDKNHHELVKKGVLHITEEEKSSGGALGRPSGARFKVYERLKRLRAGIGDQRDLFSSGEYVEKLDRAIEEIYRYPFYQTAADRLNRQIKSGARDEQLFELVLSLREEERLCVIDDREAERAPRIICSMGLAAQEAQ